MSLHAFSKDASCTNWLSRVATAGPWSRSTDVRASCRAERPSRLVAADVVPQTRFLRVRLHPPATISAGMLGSVLF